MGIPYTSMGGPRLLRLLLLLLLLLLLPLGGLLVGLGDPPRIKEPRGFLHDVRTTTDQRQAPSWRPSLP